MSNYELTARTPRTKQRRRREHLSGKVASGSKRLGQEMIIKKGERTMSKSLCKQLAVLLGLLLGINILTPAFAATLFVETFDTNTPDVTDGSYPDFTLNAGSASVTNEELRLEGGGSLFTQRFTTPGFSGDLTICGKVRAATFGASFFRILPKSEFEQLASALSVCLAWMTNFPAQGAASLGKR